MYPAHDEFVKSVRAEAEDNVKRLRHHPSIAIFCGNNEGILWAPSSHHNTANRPADYQMVLQWGGPSAFLPLILPIR